MFCMTKVSMQSGLQDYEKMGACLTTHHHIPEERNLQGTLCISQRMQSITRHLTCTFCISRQTLHTDQFHNMHLKQGIAISKISPFHYSLTTIPSDAADSITKETANKWCSIKWFKLQNMVMSIYGLWFTSINHFKAQIESTCNKVSPHLTFGSHSKTHNTHSE